MEDPATLHVELFADIVCPWCFIGARRLNNVLAAWPKPLTVELRYRPFLLMPEAPAAGLDLRDYLRNKYGRDPEPMFARVEAAARDAGIDLDLKKQPFAYPTEGAHTLLRHAAERGTQVALAEALYGAYFLEGENIADPLVLTRVGTRHGFSADEVIDLLRDEAEQAATQRQTMRAAELGIHGVPFFLFNGRLALSGAQPATVFRAAIEEALS